MWSHLIFSVWGAQQNNNNKKIKKQKNKKKNEKKKKTKQQSGMKMAWLRLPVPSHPSQHPSRCPTVLPLPPPQGPGPGAQAGSSGRAGGLLGCWLVRLRPVRPWLGVSALLSSRWEAPWRSGLGGIWWWAGVGFSFFSEDFGWAGEAGRCGFGFIVHLQGDGGVKAAPSGAVLVDLESGIGRGTGLATGGGGGSKNDPGTLPWPLPLGCEQHK